MAPVPSVRVIKSFPFKGGTRLWSNRYHFNGGTPSSGAHWDTLFDAITAAEKLQYLSATSIVSAVGYAAGSDVPVRSKTYALPGTLSPAGSDTPAPGEVVALLRYSTSARSTKNHPIYLFNYFHGVCVGEGTNSCDTLSPDQKTAIATYAAAWITGFSDGTITAVRAGPNGDAATGEIVEEYVTHRDFPYTRSL